MNIRDFDQLAENNDWTQAFKGAVDALCEAGGGTLFVPAGRYDTGPIELKSGITLHLDAGAVLRFYNDPEIFPLVDMEFEGISGKAYMPLVFARDAHHVRVTGDGLIDGNGSAWWALVREKKLCYPRPYLVCFMSCRDVIIDHVTLVNSPSWTAHPLYCDHVTISHVTIRNPSDSPNTDGIDPDGSSNVRITDCLIDVGDDCIAIKSGTEDTKNKQPCENILISGCHMLSGHGGVVVGSEMSGSVRNVQVSNCIFKGTDRGIRIKTRRGRGGVVENLMFSHILMEDVLCPFVFNMYYFCGKDGKLRRVWDKDAYPLDDTTPVLRDIVISDVTVNGASSCAGFLYGLAERPVERVRLRDVTVIMRKGKKDVPAMMDGIAPMEGKGFYLRNGQGICFDHVTILGADGVSVEDDTSVQWENPNELKS